MKAFLDPGLRPGPRLGRLRGPHASAFARTDSGALRRDLAVACRSSIGTSGGGPRRSLAGALRAPLIAGVVVAATLTAGSAPFEAQAPATGSQTQGAAAQTQPARRREVSPEDRTKIEAAVPAKALARPKKPRKLLVFDRQGIYNGRQYGGHASIPHANLAAQLMGEKTGAFTATLSSEPGAISAANLQQYDAVYLNNTVGDVFDTPEMRAAFVAFVANGGGVVGNHGASVASPQWTEFGEILGATGASHREPTEKATINIEDPTHPLVLAFDGKPFEYVDEFYRLGAPYSREKVRVLLSIDPIVTDMMQGRCFGQCLRDDNDYPVAWIRQHGKARVFYTSLGHNPDVFWDTRMLTMFLSGIQYALGDLEADATPRPRGTTQFDAALAAMTQYDFGRDPAQVRRFEREVSLAAATKEGAADAEQKMLKVLQSQAPLGAKDAICRQLAIIGSSRSELVLKAMLKNKDTEAMARYALHGLQAK
jgi:type 1 glutamine amidotransferase